MSSGVMKKNIVDHKDWMAKGRELFGKDTSKWIFVCPICNKEQSNEDFLKLGVNAAETGALAFSCIGRFIKGSYEPFGTSGTKDKSNGCNYTSGGFFCVNKKFIKIEGEEKESPVFMFKGEA